MAWYTITATTASARMPSRPGQVRDGADGAGDAGGAGMVDRAHGRSGPIRWPDGRGEPIDDTPRAPVAPSVARRRSVSAMMTPDAPPREGVGPGRCRAGRRAARPSRPSRAATAQDIAGQDVRAGRRRAELTVATSLPAPGFWDGADVDELTGGFEDGIARALADRFDLELRGRRRAVRPARRRRPRRRRHGAGPDHDHRRARRATSTFSDAVLPRRRRRRAAAPARS